MRLRLFVIGICIWSPVSALAHQPVMDMAPRWQDGYGFQIRHEYYGSASLRSRGDRIANPLGRERFVHKTWLEGVYTFDRAKRITFKLPYIDQMRVKDIGGAGVRQDESGLGDLIIGVPLKRYRNKGANTSNWGITPSIRLPTGKSGGDFPISDGSVDLGLSVSYSAEGYPIPGLPRFKLYQLYDLYYWHNRKGARGMNEGDEVGLDVNIGIHPFHDDQSNTGVFLMWDVSVRAIEAPNAATLTTASGGERIHTGPIIVVYKNNIMFRAEYKFPVYQKTYGVSNARGDEFSVGIGVAF